MPLVLLGMVWAVPVERPLRLGWAGLGFAGAMLALSVLAGHPQTTYFSGYLAAAFLGYRVWRVGGRWTHWLAGMAVVGGVAALLSAVQWWPALEFSAYSYRAAIPFAERGGGYGWEEAFFVLFPFRQITWMPQYIGLVPLVLVIVACWGRVPGWGFWLGSLVAALLLALGSKTPFYHLLYLGLPGTTLFRGQERATFIIAHSAALLAGLGAAWLAAQPPGAEVIRRLKRLLLGLLAVSWVFSLLFLILAQTEARSGPTGAIMWSII
ncbi:MAG: hypothetical protein HC915_11085 [Anaerolineae bacterium]|nr:hypothetical protein [Anaerolineae bacterium]